jgi:hypothetical protein
MASQFAAYIDADGNLWMDAGTVQAFHSTTVFFRVGSGEGQILVSAPSIERSDLRQVARSTSMQGGSGRNVRVSGGPGGTTVPVGFFPPAGPDSFIGPRGAVITFTPGDGSAELHNGTDVLATLPPGGTTIAPYGTFSSTPYGDTLNGGAPFTIDVSYEGSADPFPARSANVNVYAGTAQGDGYTRTGWQSWESAADPSWTLAIDGLGEGEMSDGTDIVARRDADASKLYDPSGTWNATLYGMATYHAADAWLAEVTLMSGSPVAGSLYVELVLDIGTNELLSVNGPFFAAVVPPNVPSEFAYVLIAVSDGFGGIDQVQEGPIYWKP